MIEELINYEFKNKQLEDNILNLDDNLITIGDSFINSYISLKINTEFVYYDDGIKYYFDYDLLNNLKLQLLSNDNLADRAIKIHLDNVSNKNDRYHDLFKALIGAYVLDNVIIDYDKIDNWLNTNDSILLSIENSSNYYKQVYSWSKNKYKKVPVFNTEIVNNEYKATVKLEEFDVFSGSGNTKYLALINACKEAYSHLEDNDMLLKMEDVVGYPDIDKCINQLQELFVKGFINEPQYKIAMKGSSNGVDVWKCRILIDGYKESFSSEDTSKKNAKRNCAFEMLKYIMEEK